MGITSSSAAPKGQRRASYNKRQSQERKEPEPKASETYSGSEIHTEASTTVATGQAMEVFWQIRVESTIQWGLLPQLIKWLQRQGLIIVDHRTWHDPKPHHPTTTTVVNEIYCRDTLVITNKQSLDSVIQERIKMLKASLKKEMQHLMVTIRKWSPSLAKSHQTSRRQRTRSTPASSQLFASNEETLLHRAKLLIDGKSYTVCLDDSALIALKRRGDGRSKPIPILPEPSPYDHLHGLIR